MKNRGKYWANPTSQPRGLRRGLAVIASIVRDIKKLVGSGTLCEAASDVVVPYSVCQVGISDGLVRWSVRKSA